MTNRPSGFDRFVDIVGIACLVLLLLCVASVFFGCASTIPTYTRQPLFEQRLAPTQGYKGLTNQVCASFVEGKCVMSYVSYDLELPEVRKQLWDLKFICNVAGKRYGTDLDKPVLINQECGGFFSRKCKPEDVIDTVKEQQRLLDANTICAAQESEFGKSLFLK